MSYSSKINDVLVLIKSKTFKSISLIMSANLLNALIGFAITVLVLRKVDNDVIAFIYPLISVLMIAGQLGDLGLSNSFIKLASQYFVTDNERSLRYFNAAVKIRLIIGFSLLVLGLIFAKSISILLFDKVLFVDYVRLILVVSFIQILAGYFTSSLQIESKFKTLSFIKVFPSFAKMIMLLTLLYTAKINYSGIFWAFSLVPLLTFLISFLTARKDPILNWNSQSIEVSEMLHLSKWFGLSVVANALMSQSDIVMVSHMAGADELVRLLGGQKLAAIVGVFSSAFGAVLFPKISGMKDKTELNFFLRKALFLLMPFVLILSLLLPLSKWVIPWLLGAKYQTSISVFNVFMVGNFIGLLVTPVSLILYKLNKEPLFAYLNIGQFLINIVGNYLFIPQYGAFSAALVTVMAKVLAVFVIYRELNKERILFVHREKKK